MVKKHLGSTVGGLVSTQPTGEQPEKTSNMSDKETGLKVPDVAVSLYAFPEYNLRKILS